jgi:hypothetical protein
VSEHLTEWIESLHAELEALRTERDVLACEAAQFRAERDAITRASYYRDGPDAFYGCDVLGSATDYRYRYESVVIGEIRAAAGLGPIPAEAPR